MRLVAKGTRSRRSVQSLLLHGTLTLGIKRLIIVRKSLHSVYHVSEETTSITKCDLDLCVDSRNCFVEPSLQYHT